MGTFCLLHRVACVKMGAAKKEVKVKTKEKLNNSTLFRPENYTKFLNDVPKGRVITPASVSDKFKINERVVVHSSLHVYTRTAAQTKLAEEKAAAALKAEQEAAEKKAAKAAKAAGKSGK